MIGYQNYRCLLFILFLAFAAGEQEQVKLQVGIGYSLLLSITDHSTKLTQQILQKTKQNKKF